MNEKRTPLGDLIIRTLKDLKCPAHHFWQVAGIKKEAYYRLLKGKM